MITCKEDLFGLCVNYRSKYILHSEYAIRYIKICCDGTKKFNESACIVCQNDRFGRECSMKCNCSTTEICSPVDGECYKADKNEQKKDNIHIIIPSVLVPILTLGILIGVVCWKKRKNSSREMDGPEDTLGEENTRRPVKANPYQIKYDMKNSSKYQNKAKCSDETIHNEDEEILYEEIDPFMPEENVEIQGKGHLQNKIDFKDNTELSKNGKGEKCTVIQDQNDDREEYENLVEAGNYVEQAEPIEYEKRGEQADYQKPEEQVVYQEPEEQAVYQEPEEQVDYEDPEEPVDYEEPEQQAVYEEPEDPVNYEEPEDPVDYEEPNESADYEEPEGPDDYEEQGEIADYADTA